MTWTASVVTCMAISEALHLAMAASRENSIPWSFIQQARCTRRRAPSTFMAISAIMAWTISKEAIGLPNCTRTLAYSLQARKAASAMPTEIEPTKGRAASRVSMAMRKPWPSRPRRSSTGTKQSWKISSVVLEARIPILFSALPMVKPGVPLRTMKAVRPRTLGVLRVLAKTTNTSAKAPLVIKHLVPLRT